MIAALAAEDVLAAGETPVNVLDKTAPQPAPGETGDSDPEEKDGKDAAGAPPTASPHSTPSAARSKANPGYPHGPPPADSNSRHP